MATRSKFNVGKWAVWAAMVTVSLVWNGCRGGVSGDHPLFTYNASDGVRSLDPGKATDLESQWVVDQLYEGLLELDNALDIQPALAEAWSVSEDGLTYAFRLRRNAVFHSGSPVTAQDVEASFQRLMDPGEALPGRWVLADLDPVNGIEVLGPDSLHLKLRSPQPVFPGLLATPHAAVIEHGGRGGDPDAGEGGSGPFVLKGWLPETAMVLHRFDRYWMRDAEGTSLPYLDGVRIEFNREAGAEFLGFRQGRYDFVSALDPTWAAALRGQDGNWKPEWEGRFVEYRIPYLKTDYIGFLVDSAACASAGFILPDAGVRRALSMALDRSALVRELRAGEAAPAAGFVPPGMPGFGPDERLANTALDWKPDSARSLLASFGIGPEPPLARLKGITLGTKPGMADLAAALQFAWSAYGVDVDIDIAPSAIDAERVARSQVPMFRKSWLADYPDAENFLSLFHEERWCPNGPNYTHYANVEVTNMLDEAASTRQGPAREALLREVESTVLEDMPVIPLWHDEVVHLVASGWTGWQVSPTNRLDLRRVRAREE